MQNHLDSQNLIWTNSNNIKEIKKKHHFTDLSENDPVYLPCPFLFSPGPVAVSSSRVVVVSESALLSTL